MLRPMNELPLTNNCVVVCDLALWDGPSSACWHLLTGSQSEVGHRLAVVLRDVAVQRLDDFGGVCASFLTSDDGYAASPPHTTACAAVFSFTPKNKLASEGLEMARAAHASGYRLLIITSQKQGKFGKVWVLQAALSEWAGEPLTYYEDTATVIDELKASSVGDRVIAVHVLSPSFEDLRSTGADRVVSQDEYRREVLQRPSAQPRT
jgi:hypothetical protein